MTAIQREIIRAMMDTNGNAAQAARKINKTRNTVCYHLCQIQQETGLDPKSFNDLLILKDMVQSEGDLADTVKHCARCGVELNKQNILHTRIITCDEYSNTDIVDVRLCVGCAAKVTAVARGRGDG